MSISEWLNKVDMRELGKALKYIGDFCYNSYGYGENYSDGYLFDSFEKMPIAYTEREEDGEPVQVYVNLVRPSIWVQVGTGVRYFNSYASLMSMNELLLSSLDFDELVSLGH